MKLKVFLIEDDEAYAEFIKKSLRKDYQIYSFITAEDCLVTMKSIDPDVLIIDYNLPGMSGIDLYDEVKNTLHPDVKVIMMSAIDDGNLVLEFIRKGVRDYVVKDEKVINTLKSVIEGKDDIYFDE
ncbi:MAG: response regulator [Bacteroidota bacterium]